MDGQKGQCPLLAPGAGPAGPWQPAAASRSAAAPAPPGPGKGRAAGIDRGRSAPLGRRGGPRRREDLCHRSASGAEWDPPVPLHLCCGGEAEEEPARESRRRPPQGWGAEPRDRGTPSPFPGLPTPQPAPRRQGRPRSSLPAPDAHAVCNEKSVSGSAQPGRGGGRVLGRRL